MKQCCANMNAVLLVQVVLCVAYIPFCCSTPVDDEIMSLPGLSWKPSFRQFSGYLQATGSKHLHYWFVESQRNPLKDPLVLWMNGGPGCSSLDGLLSEHGPFTIADDGATLIKNPYSWNKVASVLYLEAPAGVGFSYSDDQNYTSSDDETSLNNYVALQSFFKLFPEYKGNDFYVTGESYGGIYVPTLSVRILDDPSFNFKGFAVGNGISDFSINSNSLVYYAYYHGIFSQRQWLNLVRYCCKNGNSTLGNCEFSNPASAKCASIVEEVNEEFSGLNIYNLYDECYQPQRSGNTVSGKISVSLPTLLNYRLPPSYGQLDGDTAAPLTVRAQQLQHLHQMLLKYGNGNVSLDVPCINATAVTNYLNTAEVRKALHIPSSLPPWALCSGDVSAHYHRQYDNVKEFYLKVLSKKARILVYNGDFDMACNYLGDEWFVDSLNLPMIQSWSHWYYNGKYGTKQIGGFLKKYSNLTFVTIRGAGHMVPTDKPAEALVMIDNFLSGKF